MIRSLILVVHGLQIIFKLITMSLEQMRSIERIITDFGKIACSMFMLSTAIRTLRHQLHQTSCIFWAGESLGYALHCTD